MTKPIRFALIGGGWRARFFTRIARELPAHFEVTATLLRSEEKCKEWMQTERVKATTSLETLLLDAPDFVVLSVSKAEAPNMLCKLLSMHVPVLCETPPTTNLADLADIWRMAKKSKVCCAVCEQYPHQPIYQAYKAIADGGKLGKISNVSLSVVHDYHAMAVLRFLLGVGFQNATITGERLFFPVQATDSRQAILTDGDILTPKRDRATIVFENGQTAFYDFSPVQYHSFIRSRHFCMQGTRGEIDQRTVRYLNNKNEAIEETIVRRDLGVYDGNRWAHDGLLFDGSFVYRNPFAYARLNDDEIAVATCLSEMGKAVRGEANQSYPLAEALQDTYLYLQMQKALEGATVVTTTQVWTSPA